jgi:hypothetical protein
MNMATGFDRRHPRGVTLIRVLVTVWLFGLTGILLARGYWGWALLTPEPVDLDEAPLGGFY